MDDIGLLEAWSRWASGPLRDSLLWGLEIWWWGRIGILLSATGIVGLIVDIVGPDKLREIGRNLKDKAHIREQAETVRKMVLVTAKSVAFVLALCLFLGFGIKGLVNLRAHVESSLLQDVIWFIIALLLLICVYFLIPAMKPILMGMLLMLVMLARETALHSLAGAAWIMEHRHLRRALHVFILLALVIGLHFDLLAT